MEKYSPAAKQLLELAKNSREPCTGKIARYLNGPSDMKVMWMLPNLAKSSVYFKAPGVFWQHAWQLLHIWWQLSESVELRVRQSICYFVLNTRKVPRINKNVKLQTVKQKPVHQMHNSSGT